MSPEPQLYTPPVEYTSYDIQDGNATRLFLQIQSTRWYGKLYNKFTELVQESYDEIPRLHDRFAGVLYRQIAYHHLRRLTDSSQTVYSYGNTVRLFSHLYPMAAVTKDPFGLLFLEGFSLPDGVITGAQNQQEDGKIKVLQYCVYTPSNNLNVHTRKYTAFTGYKNDHPDIFKDTRIVYVLPHAREKPTIAHTEDVDIQYVPFTRTALREFTGGIIREVTSS